MQPTVSIKRCHTYGPELHSAIAGAVDLLGGIGSFVKKGERILIKPNILSGKPPEAAVTTHPEAVKSVIRLVKDAGATPVVGDSPGFGSFSKITEKCGIKKACIDAGAELIELKDPTIADNPDGHTFKRLEVSKTAIEFDGIINIPKLKTHVQMYLTLGVKNMFGCVPGTRKAQWHLEAGVDSSHFASMLLDLCLFLKPRLTILDGVVAMEGNGPGSGEPRDIGIMAASPSAIALDSHIAHSLGAKPDDVPVLKAALQRGIRDAAHKEVRIAGDPFEVKGFKFPPLISSNFTSSLPYFIDRPLRKALTTRPRIDEKLCTLCKVCVQVCPPGVMKREAKITIDYDKCIRCYCCQEMCPQGAITPQNGWLKKLFL